MKLNEVCMKNIKFEDALAELESIISKLDTGALSLDDAIVEYEKAVKLIKVCTKKLETAEAKVRVLVESPDGSITDKEFITSDET